MNKEQQLNRHDDTRERYQEQATLNNEIVNFDIVDDMAKNINEGNLRSESTTWRVLVVDDDAEVHESTEFALRKAIILNKPIELIHAYSANEGFELIQREEDLAVVLLDVVMESDDAGLKLVKRIRDSGYTELRIVLRTGQPGYAPEQSVLSDYDINDYRTKSELTRARLVSLLTTSFRCYRQLHVINESRRGLHLIVKSARDIFVRKNMDAFCRGVLTQLVALLDSSSDGVACVVAGNESANELNSELKVVSATGRFKGFIDKPLREIDDQKIKDTLQRAQNAEMGIHIDGSLGLCFSSFEGARMYVYVSSCSNTSEEYLSLLKIFASNIAIGFENLALIERLDELAYIDSQTGIPNRNAVEQEFNRLRQEGKPLAIALVHINAINQSVSAFGIPTVNQALVSIWGELKSSLNQAPYFIGYDGSANLVLLVDKNNVDVKEINSVFDHRIKVENLSLALTATISVVNVEKNMSAEDALRCATSAMVISKATPGTNFMYYNQAVSQGLTERILLLSSLKHALQSGEGIEAYLQPKVDCRNGALIGAEALCRWTLDGRMISPADFIPLAEASGLVCKLTELMIQYVGDFAKGRESRGQSAVPVAVNLSVHDLLRPDFSEWILKFIDDLGLNPNTLEFEVTESVMLDPDRSIAALENLQKSGFSIAIDDFGTGYSSLSYLEKLPVNTIKIDKTFVDTLHIQTAKTSLVSITITIAEQMGLTVVAEGIETEEQHNALLSLGCQVCQGFYFGKPVPIDEFSRIYSYGSVLISNRLQ